MVLLTNVERDFRVGRCLCCAMLHFEGVSLRKLIGADLYLSSMSKGRICENIPNSTNAAQESKRLKSFHGILETLDQVPNRNKGQHETGESHRVVGKKCEQCGKTAIDHAH